MLGALGAWGAASLLGSCASGEDPGAADGGADGKAGQQSAGSADRRLLTSTADVAVGGGKLLGQILVVQPTAGEFKAFSAVCPHRGARVSPPENGLITCYEHMSTFRDADGTVVSGPAVSGLTPIAVTVEGTAIYLT
ncbi:Rieske (2Fe-2S) protein [Spirilliplanes yamanashiensis]|uniref:Rieske domain-containing protein n=1 Tax=Spirilliplanes yamanashiensis TaxID=42233 RepID=A0A8J3YEX0_9ACTN|nr:Rieske (2Fe-2S) protein [Spirilliplanes yamanashiensis]MDP9818462.1 nitrite reductase/ring-hydroxylating ferredoxin subunit [Spirilliplanes yamanashiensis]GIJ06413.1 hypothetical protein Sya03_57650 [Spirilliplanes yamanashiensis]